jgi:hypothetical protein
MSITIDIEGNELVINKLVALLKSIPDLKIQTRKRALRSGFIPNSETKKAIEDAITGNECKSYKNSTEMFKSLGINV